MTTKTHDMEIYVLGETICAEATVSYTHDEASGDGWHEPRYPARVVLEAVEINIAGQREVDLLPLLSDEQVARIEGDLLREIESQGELI